MYSLVSVPRSEAEDGGQASVTLVGCAVNADWTRNAAAGLCVDAYSDTRKCPHKG